MFDNIKKAFNVLLDNPQAMDKPEQKAIDYMQSMGFSFLGQWINNCGKVSIGLDTMYEIAKTNKMAWAYIEKISNMVWRFGLELYDEKGEKMDNRKAKEIIATAESLFQSWFADNKTFGLFAYNFFSHIFCSGEATFAPNMMNMLFQAPKDWYMKFMDTRGIRKVADEYGNLQFVEYRTKTWIEKLLPEQVVNFIAYPNLDNPLYWLSKFNRIYIEAITNREANNRQMYFFKNNAVPNLMVMMDGEKLKNKESVEAFAKMWDAKFQWSNNASKPLISDIVKDVKQLDVTNVDMDFINLRKENDKDFAVIFLLDTRLIGLSKDTGSYWEIESTTIRQGNDQIDAYGKMLSDAINIAYKKFVDPSFAYKLKCKNSYFTDDIKEKDVAMREVQNGVRTPNEYITEFGRTPSDQEGMDTYKVQQVQSWQQPIKN